MSVVRELCHCSVGCHCDNRRHIDTAFQHIAQALHATARDHCPITTGTFFKPYWDEEMTELKRQSIDIHQLWVACGRPNSGHIYTYHCWARAEYRWAIKYKTQVTSTHISNDLHAQLLSKDCASFWKPGKIKSINDILLLMTSMVATMLPIIANSFATHFPQACQPNSSDYNEKLNIRSQPFYCSVEFVRDNPGEPVPEETFTHSHSSWSSIIPICFLHL